MIVCPVCHGEGEVQFNPSWRNDPQMVESGLCDECHGTGSVEGCVPPIGVDQGSEPPLLAHPVGGTEPLDGTTVSGGPRPEPVRAAGARPKEKGD